MAISAGRFHLGHLGGYTGRWEILPFGDALEEVMEVSGMTIPGEVVATPSCKSLLGGDLATELRSDELGIELVQQLNRKPYEPAPQYTESPVSEEIAAAYVPSPAKVASDVAEGEEELALSQIRVVAVCFVNFDLPGTTESKEEWFQGVHRTVVQLQEVVAFYDGSMRQVIKDDKGGCTAIFLWGVPGKDHEDNAYRACVAALKMSVILSGERIVPYIGVTLGDAICGNVGSRDRCEYSATGPTINLAARLMMANDDKGGILCSEEVHSGASEGNIDALGFTHIGKTKVKGREEPVSTYKLDHGRESAEDEVEGRLSMVDQVYCEAIGRCEALLAVANSWALPQVAYVTGDPLFGKSLLLDRFSSMASSEAEVLLCRGAGGVRLLWEQILACVCGDTHFKAIQKALTELDVLAQREKSYVAPPEQLSEALASLLPGIGCTFLSLQSLLLKDGLGIDCEDSEATCDIPVSMRLRIMVETLMCAFVRRMLTYRTVVILVDDADEADTHTWSLIDSLLHLPEAPLLVVLTLRTHEQALSASQQHLLASKSIEHKHLSHIPLEAIDNAGCHSLIKDRSAANSQQTEENCDSPSSFNSDFHSSKLKGHIALSTDSADAVDDGNKTTSKQSRSPFGRKSGVPVKRESTVDSRVVNFVQNASGGNPLFARKLVDAMISLGVVNHPSSGTITTDHDKLRRCRVSNLLPTTVASEVRKKMDKVNPRAQTVAKIASVVGVEWSVEELSATLDRVSKVSDLHDSLGELEDVGLLRRSTDKVWSFTGRTYWRIIYEMLPTMERRRVHLAAAMSIRHIAVTQYGTQAATTVRSQLLRKVGWQYTNAGEMFNGFKHLMLAADEAIYEGATTEAQDSCNRGIELLDHHLTGLSEIERQAKRAHLLSLSAEATFRQRASYNEALQTALRAWQNCVPIIEKLDQAEACSCAWPSSRVQDSSNEEEGLAEQAATVVGTAILVAKYSLFAMVMRYGHRTLRECVKSRGIARVAMQKWQTGLEVYANYTGMYLGWKKAARVRAKFLPKQLEEERFSWSSQGRMDATAEAFRWAILAETCASHDKDKMAACYHRALGFATGDDALVGLMSLQLALGKHLQARFKEAESSALGFRERGKQPSLQVLTSELITVASAKVRRDEVAGAANALQQCEEVLSQHSLSLFSLDLSKHFISLKAICAARGGNYGEAVALAEKCLSLLREQDGFCALTKSTLWNCAESVQLVRLSALVGKSEREVMPRVATLDKLVKKLFRRWMPCMDHLEYLFLSFKMTRSNHLGKHQRAERIFEEVRSSKGYTRNKYSRLRSTFELGAHMLEINRGKNNRFERRGMELLADFLEAFDFDEFTETYELKRAKVLTSGGSIL